MEKVRGNMKNKSKSVGFSEIWYFVALGYLFKLYCVRKKRMDIGATKCSELGWFVDRCPWHICAHTKSCDPNLHLQCRPFISTLTCLPCSLLPKRSLSEPCLVRIDALKVLALHFQHPALTHIPRRSFWWQMDRIHPVNESRRHVG